MATKDPTFAPPLSQLLTATPVLTQALQIQAANIVGFPGDGNRVLAGDGSWPNASGYVYGYQEFTTTATTSTSTSEAVPQLVVAAPQLTLTSLPIVVEFFAPQVAAPAVANAQIILSLWDGSTNLGRWGLWNSQVAGVQTATAVYLRKRIVPTFGVHNYKAQAWLSGSSGSSNGAFNAGNGGSGSQMPGFIRVSKS